MLYPAGELVGCALGALTARKALRFRSVWLAFSNAMERENAKHKLYGQRWYNASVKLWVEDAEARNRRSGESARPLFSFASRLKAEMLTGRVPLRRSRMAVECVCGTRTAHS